jgi:NADH dehydrogenase [ubiquinone] 1 alpha subcomplex assembly factor 7
MTQALARILAETIREQGPMSVADYMAAALGHPEHGYYTGHDPFGLGGDFTTAPEISQMFGELIGLWCLLTWQAMGSPERLVLAEIGPGRGTLMADLLRTAQVRPPFAAALEVVLVETSPALRNRQAQTLAGHKVAWVERVEDLPPGPLLVVANELFDALPIRQFERQGGVWRERRVGLDPDGGFVFVTGAETDRADLPTAADDGAIAEIGEAGLALAGWLGRRLATTSGAALIIDYGHQSGGFGDTFQAVRRHRYHPVLRDPGHVDLTAHVDFARLAAAAVAAGARVDGPVSQGLFLSRMGLEERARMLMQTATPEQAATLAAGARRLIDPGEMGTLFRVLALASPTLPKLSALDAPQGSSPP